jgi:hypothetical protein
MEDTLDFAWFTDYLFSWVVFVVFLCIQIRYCIYSYAKLNKLKNFFPRDKDYEVITENEKSELKVICSEGKDLKNIINELNKYLFHNKGTTDFSIIQNKIERKINLKYEEATSKIGFPIYLGLMGTFSGVFMGLFFFQGGLAEAHDGITDYTIKELISGVLISMSTSFIGLAMSTFLNNKASNIKEALDKEKNLFFDFIQNELLPNLGTSIVASLEKLHYTINLFEPTFNKVISNFQNTFDSCTRQFGDAFSNNVTIVSEAVATMGRNMDKINENVDKQTQLLQTLKTSEIVDTLYTFVESSKHFVKVTKAINQFEEVHKDIYEATNVLINQQRSFNDSLEVPKQIANDLNNILNRITTFEKNIEGLGDSINKEQLFSNLQIEIIREQINAIKEKQKIAYSYMETASGDLEDIFELQKQDLKRINDKFEEAVGSYADRFNDELVKLNEEIIRRREDIIHSLEEKFSLENIRNDFSELERLKNIETLISENNSKNLDKEISETISKISNELSDIKHTISQLEIDSQKISNIGNKGSFISGLFGHKK